MNARDIRLVEVVSANPHISSADLSSAFDISERTLRTYVRRINEELDGIARVHRHRGGGYSLLVDDVEAWESWLEANRRDGVRATPSTPAERVSYLVNDLVMRRSWITLDDLSEMLYVSKSALSNDLHEVERRLAQFNLVLEKRPRYGLRVSGTEMSRRLCLAAGAMEANEGVNRKVGDADAFPSRTRTDPRTSTRSPHAWTRSSLRAISISTPSRIRTCWSTSRSRSCASRRAATFPCPRTDSRPSARRTSSRSRTASPARSASAWASSSPRGGRLYRHSPGGQADPLRRGRGQPQHRDLR